MPTCTMPLRPAHNANAYDAHYASGIDVIVSENPIFVRKVPGGDTECRGLVKPLEETALDSPECMRLWDDFLDRK